MINYVTEASKMEYGSPENEVSNWQVQAEGMQLKCEARCIVLLSSNHYWSESWVTVSTVESLTIFEEWTRLNYCTWWRRQLILKYLARCTNKRAKTAWKFCRKEVPQVWKTVTVFVLSTKNANFTFQSKLGNVKPYAFICGWCDWKVYAQFWYSR